MTTPIERTHQPSGVLYALVRRNGQVMEIARTAERCLYRWSEFFGAGHRYHSLMSYNQRKRYIESLHMRIVKCRMSTVIERKA